MEHETILRYLELRELGKIGRLWTNPFKLCSIGILPGLEYQHAEPILESDLIRLIDKLYLENLKRSCQSETINATVKIVKIVKSA